MSAAPLVPEILVDDSATEAEARDFLLIDRIGAAYALADLDGEAESAHWWLARRAERPIAAVLVVDSLPFRPTFAMGDVAGIGEILAGLRETRVVFSAPINSRPFIEAVYRFERVDRMYRMAVTRRTFTPSSRHTVTRLGEAHLDDIIELYGHVSRSYFTPERVEREIYYGIYAGRTLAAAAGTHTRTTRSDLAAVGNVLTRPAWRGQGLATAVTSAVTEAAVAEYRDVVLNVRQDNAPAVAVYLRLGYAIHSPYLEGPAARRAGWERITKKLFGANDGGNQR